MSLRSRSCSGDLRRRILSSPSRRHRGVSARGRPGATSCESELRGVSVASLAAAIDGNYYGTELYVDRTQPPVNDDVLDLEKRYHVDVQASQLVAVVTERY